MGRGAGRGRGRRASRRASEPRSPAASSTKPGAVAARAPPSPASGPGRAVRGRSSRARPRPGRPGLGSPRLSSARLASPRLAWPPRTDRVAQSRCSPGCQGPRGRAGRRAGITWPDQQPLPPGAASGRAGSGAQHPPGPSCESAAGTTAPMAAFSTSATQRQPPQPPPSWISLWWETRGAGGGRTAEGAATRDRTGPAPSPWQPSRGLEGREETAPAPREPLAPAQAGVT